jgi:hypothetical protein
MNWGTDVHPARAHPHPKRRDNRTESPLRHRPLLELIAQQKTHGNETQMQHFSHPHPQQTYTRIDLEQKIYPEKDSNIAEADSKSPLSAHHPTDFH